ncbi:MAG: methyltransferase [Bacteroidota bacterium]|nr:methyltransferase [Bacteroidota bacterium]
MPNPYFQFKQFTVWHDKCAMKVGTDGVLLGAWAAVEEAKTILDVGTGSGLIALMAAQRNSDALITAIDIEETATIQAEENFNRSPWQERFTVHHASLEQYALTANATFDVIISNPPYFHQSLHSPDKKRTLARHTAHFTQDTLLANCCELLADNGSIYLILPVTEGEILLNKAIDHKLFCTHKTLVFPTPSSSPKRLLIALAKTQQPLLEDAITIESGIRHHYSEDFARMLQAFYLKL